MQQKSFGYFWASFVEQFGYKCFEHLSPGATDVIDSRMLVW